MLKINICPSGSFVLVLFCFYNFFKITQFECCVNIFQFSFQLDSYPCFLLHSQVAFHVICNIHKLIIKREAI